MAKTGAERQRAYRERIRQDPEKNRIYLNNQRVWMRGLRRQRYAQDRYEDIDTEALLHGWTPHSSRHSHGSGSGLQSQSKATQEQPTDDFLPTETASLTAEVDAIAGVLRESGWFPQDFTGATVRGRTARGRLVARFAHKLALWGMTGDLCGRIWRWCSRAKHVRNPIGLFSAILHERRSWKNYRSARTSGLMWHRGDPVNQLVGKRFLPNYWQADLTGFDTGLTAWEQDALHRIDSLAREPACSGPRSARASRWRVLSGGPSSFESSEFIVHSPAHGKPSLTPADLPAPKPSESRFDDRDRNVAAELAELERALREGC